MKKTCCNQLPYPAFQDMMEQIKSLLRYAFQTNNALTFSVSVPGLGMCFVNLVEPGDKVMRSVLHK